MRPILFGLITALMFGACTKTDPDSNPSPAKEYDVAVVPAPYDHALRNPLKGFTSVDGRTTTQYGSGTDPHPWISVTHTYIKWNDIEDKESDGIDKIKSYCDKRWKGIAAKNMKVIPRVYLHWDGDKYYWPSDMTAGDYTSEQFKTRVVRLIERLGECWDNDPRVAFVEMGIIGHYGEQHTPSPSAENQKLLGDAFTKAFKNKKVSVRHMWQEFTDYSFGEYWDSWAHYGQMWTHGKEIQKLNEASGRYKQTYVGGEVAYGWGDYETQPGADPTTSVSVDKHRNFVINTIRWLHCTQLRWITNYDVTNPEAQAGAEEIQKAMGYRYVLDEVRFSVDNKHLEVAFDVTNVGSAPFYYQWPVEVSLLDMTTKQTIWRAIMYNVDIRKWQPGEQWTEPVWNFVGSWQLYEASETWSSGSASWAIPPSKNLAEGSFDVSAPEGTYLLALAILDPAGNLPSVKFATANYLNGGRHPMGLVTLGSESHCSSLPDDFEFDDPNDDNSLYYEEN